MKVCSVCGKENPDDGRFCSFCGQQLTIPVPGAPTNADEVTEKAKTEILGLIRSREATDRYISPVWSTLSLLMIVPISGLYAISILAIIFGLNFGGEDPLWEFFYVFVRNGMVLAFGLLFALLAFKMLWRMNSHMEREEGLRKAIMNYLMSSSRTADGDQSMVKELIAASAYDGQALTYEKKLSPKRWAYQLALVFGGLSILGAAQTAGIYYTGHEYDNFAVFALLSIVGGILEIIGLILLVILASHLMKSIYTHEIRWQGFVRSTGVALRKLEKRFDAQSGKDPPNERSMLLYVVLTIITLGAFGVYWLYVLIDDPNKHFERQHVVEDALVRAIE